MPKPGEHKTVRVDTNTVAEGACVFLDLPPGSYGLMYQAVDSDSWYFVSDVWVAYAYDRYGDGLGFTDQITLNVTNP